ncbi:MAG: hypothetical protein CL674_10155 [Bdellovibrionaceae bacterium]|nr:hypothetical protein [Pseudobdellovibrionaceae bacterium]|tara:strand:- start:30378 stop:30944 length:567 start_codon:yes stop_codon:yes gene_type:complete
MSRTTEFKKEEIIEKAMQVFWEKGYDQTSLKDLIEATGLLKGSLYNTFGSKEKLFLECLEHYGQFSKSRHYKEGDPVLYLKKFFKRLIAEGVDRDFRKGCLIMNSCLEFANQENALAKKAQTLFAATELNLKNVAELACAQQNKNSEELKTNLITAAFSIREISKFRKDKKFLTQIANRALEDFGVQI